MEVDAEAVGFSIFSGPMVDGIGAPLIYICKTFSILQKEGSYLVYRKLLYILILITIKYVEMVVEKLIH